MKTSFLVIGVYVCALVYIKGDEQVRWHMYNWVECVQLEVTEIRVIRVGCKSHLDCFSHSLSGCFDFGLQELRPAVVYLILRVLLRK